MHSETVLGIDFGTTNSVCAVLSGGDPEVLENAEGDRTTPSVVYYTKEHEQNRPLIGQSAQNKAQDNPDRVISSIKRQMGESDFIEVDGQEYRVEEVAADIIRKVRTDAAEKLGVDRNTLKKAVITTPAYWESDRKQAVIQAAELAGFNSVRTIKEPASAAIAYGRFEPGLNKTVGVYDLGGGTFDFAVVDVNVGKHTGDGSEYKVLAQSGHPQLGGDDWDQEIVNWLASNFEKETDINPLEPHHSDEEPFAHKVREERLRAKARAAKEDLSNRANTEVNIRIPFLMDIGGESVDIDTRLTQTQFESMTQHLLEDTVDPIHTALDDAGKDIDEIDDVLLVGGSTRMPQVKELVKSVFQKEPKQRVNPDEAVAAGASIKANRDDILLLEVTPLSLGIGIKNDRFKRMIDRNERLPARTTEIFTTSNEGATAVRIPIYQGERDIASENRHLKTLIIEGMAPGSRHSAHIEVTFEVQQNGLINVRAVENTRNKSVNVELEGENRLPDEYIQGRIEEAQEMEEMDRRRQKVIEAQNDARKALKDAERLLKEFPHVFEADESDHMEKHMANVRQIRRENTATLGELRQATEDLNEWVLEIGDRVRRTGARNRSGPKQGPDVDPTEVEDNGDDGGVQTSGPDQTVTNSDTETTEDAEDWNDEGLETTPETTSTSDEHGASDDLDIGVNVGDVVEDEDNTAVEASAGDGETGGESDSTTVADTAHEADAEDEDRVESDGNDESDTGSVPLPGDGDDTDTAESEPAPLDGDGTSTESDDDDIVVPDEDDDDTWSDDRPGEVVDDEDDGGVMKIDDGEDEPLPIDGPWGSTGDEDADDTGSDNPGTSLGSDGDTPTGPGDDRDSTTVESDTGDSALPDAPESTDTSENTDMDGVEDNGTEGDSSATEVNMSGMSDTTELGNLGSSPDTDAGEGETTPEDSDDPVLGEGGADAVAPDKDRDTSDNDDSEDDDEDSNGKQSRLSDGDDDDAIGFS